MRRVSFMLLALALWAFPAAAATGSSSLGSIQITGAALIQCSGNVIEGRYSASATNTAGTALASFTATQHFTLSDGTAVTQSATLTSGTSHSFFLAGSSPVTFVELYLSASSVQSGVVRIWCSGLVEYAGASAGRDNRLNEANGDLINALYASTDGQGNGTVTVYLIDDESEGVAAGTFAHALFAPYLDTPPAENTLLGQISYSSLYALTSGEFQIVVSDPAEAKTYTTIFSAFPITNVHQ